MENDVEQRRIAIEENVRQQKEVSDSIFERGCRNEAIRIALNNKPSTYYPNGISGLLQGQLDTPHYDLINEAEKIYKWLVKEV